MDLNFLDASIVADKAHSISFDGTTKLQVELYHADGLLQLYYSLGVESFEVRLTVRAVWCSPEGEDFKALLYLSDLRESDKAFWNAMRQAEMESRDAAMQTVLSVTQQAFAVDAE